MDIELKELTKDDGREVYDMLQEIVSGENGFQNKAYGLTYKEYKEYLSDNVDMANGIGLKSEYVPQTIYWFYIDGKAVGMAKLRHYLNENLRKIGGHIAYAIRPEEREKGYGKKLLNELLKKAKEKEIKKVLITCDNDNYASRKVIEANGGKLSEINNGECKYWIIL
ncbi:MAG TPA: GNAT family N-acetyltransferase [Halanaerobiales bacterium]|nr:GNAT family N-acetyltransferase [Halanaerobiales bacterium]